MKLKSNLFTDTLPSLTKLTQLNTLSLDSNKFTFQSLEKIANPFSFANYSPQANIHLYQDGNTLSISAGGMLANDTFHWYKNGALYKTIVGDSSLTINEVGKYYVAVTNSVATKLTLYSDTITSGVLAVKDLFFTASNQNNQTLLQWSTAQETNTNYFIAERSINGINFKTIGKVFANENAAKNNYSFTDNLSNINAQTSIVFYRLKIVDEDGSYSYSEIRNIKLNDNLFIKLYPNPAKAITTLSFAAKGKYTITLSDVSGKILQTKVGAANSNKNVVQLNVSKYASGMYLIVINDEKNNKQVLRLNKE